MNIRFDFLVVSGSCVLDALPHVWVASWGGESTRSANPRSAGTVVRLRELGREVFIIIKMISYGLDPSSLFRTTLEVPRTEYARFLFFEREKVIRGDPDSSPSALYTVPWVHTHI